MNKLPLDPDTLIRQTRNWIEKVVVGCNFCPFAARELKRDSIRYRVVEQAELSFILDALLEECRRLDEQAHIETTLLILANLPGDFRDFLDQLHFAEQLLTQHEYKGIYQLASFHPDYCFAGAHPDEASNYTNRSPYPIFHLLREERISEVLEHYPVPEEIPERNIRYSNELGAEYFRTLLASCF